jgi:hypothetical protein
MTMADPEPADDVRRLWSEITGLLGDCVEELGGVTASRGAAARLTQQWEALARADIELAGRLYHGISQLTHSMGLPGQRHSPAQRSRQQLDEMLGMADIGLVAEAEREAAAMTLPDLVALGERAVRDEIDRYTDPPQPGDRETGDEGDGDRPG